MSGVRQQRHRVRGNSVSRLDRDEADVQDRADQEGAAEIRGDMAMAVARRIMAFVREGDAVQAGERVGLIRFGSRVDVYLPAGTGARVLLGQRSIAGETVIGEIGVDPALTGSSQ